MAITPLSGMYSGIPFTDILRCFFDYDFDFSLVFSHLTDIYWRPIPKRNETSGSHISPKHWHWCEAGVFNASCNLPHFSYFLHFFFFISISYYPMDPVHSIRMCHVFLHFFILIDWLCALKWTTSIQLPIYVLKPKYLCAKMKMWKTFSVFNYLLTICYLYRFILIRNKRRIDRKMNFLLTQNRKIIRSKKCITLRLAREKPPKVVIPDFIIDKNQYVGTRLWPQEIPDQFFIQRSMHSSVHTECDLPLSVCTIPFPTKNIKFAYSYTRVSQMHLWND